MEAKSINTGPHSTPPMGERNGQPTGVVVEAAAPGSNDPIAPTLKTPITTPVPPAGAGEAGTLRDAVRALAQLLLDGIDKNYIAEIPQVRNFAKHLIAHDTDTAFTQQRLDCMADRLREQGKDATFCSLFVDRIEELIARLQTEPLDGLALTPDAYPVAADNPQTPPPAIQAAALAAGEPIDSAEDSTPAVKTAEEPKDGATAEILGGLTPVLVDPASLKTEEPFSALFPIDPEMKSRIAEDMRKNGFDPAQPVVLWSGTRTLLDGHTRVHAAIEAGLTSIPVVSRSFATEDAALEYAIHAQRDRRNLTDADIVRLVEQLDQRRKRGGDRRSDAARSKTSSEVIGASSEATARLIGTSATKVEKARAVIHSNDTALQNSVATGKTSLNQAAPKARAAKASQAAGSKNSAQPATKKLPDYRVMIARIGKIRELAHGDTTALGILDRAIIELEEAARAADAQKPADKSPRRGRKPHGPDSN